MNPEPNPNNPPDHEGPEPTAADATHRPAMSAAAPEEALSFDEVVSGAFDAEQEQELPASPVKRVLAPQAEAPKLHKVLAQAGMGSRLEMEQLILEGRISVNNEPAHVGQRIQYGDSIKVNGKPVRVRIAPPPPRVLAYHKPAGEVVSHDDPQNRPTVFRRLPRVYQGKWQSVGRLDLNTEGLLLFTDSGELANRLMHPRFGLEREYAVRVLGALNNEEKRRLLDGVQLDDGVAQFGSIDILDALVELGFVASRGEGKRKLAEGAVKADDVVITAADMSIAVSGEVKLSLGKKRHGLLVAG